MATADDYEKQKDNHVEQVDQDPVLHFKLTITHKNPKGLEITVREVQKNVEKLRENKANVQASGVARIPTKCLAITTRKSPCGNGTNTFDRFELRIHKRVFHIHCSQKNFQSIISGIHTEPGMILEADEIDE